MRAFVEADPAYAPFYARLVDLLKFLLPAYQAEGKSYFGLGLGCTGGRHRSVAVVEALAKTLASDGWQVSIRHRDLERASSGVGLGSGSGCGVIGIVIVAHGGLAREYLAALEHVVGKHPGTRAVSIDADDDCRSKQAEVDAAVAAVDDGEGVVVVTDMYGSTPSNLAKRACMRTTRPAGALRRQPAAPRQARQGAARAAERGGGIRLDRGSQIHQLH